jgi:malate/lactate dehydrogenase
MANSDSRKVTVIGTGAIGAECARNIAQERLCDELVLCNRDSVKAEAVKLDLQQSLSPFWGSSRFVIRHCGLGDSAIKGSSVVILTAGIRNRPGSNRDSVAKPNLDIICDVFKKIIGIIICRIT